jgi:hypothetical protein
MPKQNDMRSVEFVPPFSVDTEQVSRCDDGSLARNIEALFEVPEEACWWHWAVPLLANCIGQGQ